MIEDHSDKVIVTLDSDPTTSVTILKYGATIISWKDKGVEQLWLSDAAKLDGSKPVRGGIPLVFPNFGKTKTKDHPTFDLPQHGFARNSTWEFLGKTKSDPLTIQFALSPDIANPEIYAKWQGKPDFTLIYNVGIAPESLNTTIEIENNGNEDFEFKWLFHTYFRVDDVEDIVVNNLTDEHCFDQLLATSYTEKSPMVNFTEEFDRIYRDIPQEKILQIIKLGHVQQNIHRQGLPDAVVWNPWTAKLKDMADFEPKTGYLNMLCIEAGKVAEFKNLKAGEKWVGGQEFRLGGEIKVQLNIY